MRKKTYIATVRNGTFVKTEKFRAYNELHAMLRLIEKFKDLKFTDLVLQQEVRKP